MRHGDSLWKNGKNVPALELAANDHITCRVNSVDLKNRLCDVETDCRNRSHGPVLRIRSPSATLAPTCRWRSRPQHQERTCVLANPPSVETSYALQAQVSASGQDARRPLNWVGKRTPALPNRQVGGGKNGTFPFSQKGFLVVPGDNLDCVKFANDFSRINLDPARCRYQPEMDEARAE